MQKCGRKDETEFKPLDTGHDVMECQLGSLAESLMSHVLVRALNHSSMVMHIRLKQHLTLFQ